ncbi:Lrp/AsnC family transcriptional regulator [Maritalea mediterranea]|uniref:Lrp/AsnC family transcriptional regulator n=1 Tax=Maritalea mediterranea TaxID=2909667 RepID=A0ABS9E3G1_9HYPH|nr:Lrp/AsnC family transcriptional regulator [Maritalea mediterranea]MCF4097400.1 Lrp/AsnC family transcriptional regulator [Maritalea mediterranea]
MNNLLKIDQIDGKILELLQKNSRISNQEIANQVGSSVSSVWRRINALEEAGVIQGYGLTVSPEKMGYQETILLQISLQRHSDDYIEQFIHLVESIPEILECYATTGEYDYVLKVLATDMRAFHRFVRNSLMRQPFISKTYSQVVMDKIKFQKAIPAVVKKG